MGKEKGQGLYIISVASRLAEVHPQTLRMYERKGLLLPERTEKNRRSYSDADISRLRRIQELTQREGLNLSGVRKVLEMEEEIAGLRDKVARLEMEVAEVHWKMINYVKDIKRQSALSTKPPTSLVLKGLRGKRR